MRNREPSSIVKVVRERNSYVHHVCLKRKPATPTCDYQDAAHRGEFLPSIVSPSKGTLLRYVAQLTVKEGLPNRSIRINHVLQMKARLLARFSP